MNITLAIGMLVGSFIGFGCCLLWLVPLNSDLKYDLWVAEDELHERDLADKYLAAIRERDNYLMSIAPQGRDKYRVWDEDAA